MSEKRRDHDRRILRTGESQRKDGLYQFRYKDSNGKRCTIYDSDLQNLREKEKEIQKQQDDGIDYAAGCTTVLNLVKGFTCSRQILRNTTKDNYSFVLNILENDLLASKKIKDIKSIDAKHFIIRLSDSGKRYQYGSVELICKVMKAAFQMAVSEGMIYRNPFSIKVSTVIKKDTKEKVALTEKQQKEWLRFMFDHAVCKKHYDECVVLLGTGLRVSEFCGLTEADLDFEKRKINVNHQLLKASDGHLYIEDTKTDKGCRSIPMSEDVYQSLKNILEHRGKPEKECEVNGYKGFILLNKNKQPQTSRNIAKWMRYAMEQYREAYPDSTMPKITPHVFRHTFCTNLNNQRMEIKKVQYLMGHSSSKITLDTYTHTDYEMVEERFREMETKIIPFSKCQGNLVQKQYG